MTTRRLIPLKGLFPAPSVPFAANSKILWPEFARHIQSMGAVRGVGGVAVNGHQGEMLSLTPQERQKVISAAREHMPTHKWVISGLLASSITESVQQLRQIKAAGANAALVMPPFDYMPRRILARSWHGPYAYFAELADKVDLPLLIFQYPHASGLWYDTETMLRLAEIDQVIGTKHAIRHLELYAEQWEALRGKIAVLAARDAPGLLSKMMLGADGVCIGISNIATSHWAKFTTLCLAHRFNEAREIFVTHLMPLISHVWSERVPRRISYSASTKEALVQLGVFSSSHVRSPEVNVSPADIETIRAGLIKAGLLKP
jgi:4-hydroxy-tetrahydrodipicolinate synthase